MTIGFSNDQFNEFLEILLKAHRESVEIDEESFKLKLKTLLVDGDIQLPKSKNQKEEDQDVWLQWAFNTYQFIVVRKQEGINFKHALTYALSYVFPMIPKFNIEEETMPELLARVPVFAASIGEIIVENPTATNVAAAKFELEKTKPIPIIRDWVTFALVFKDKTVEIESYIERPNKVGKDAESSKGEIFRKIYTLENSAEPEKDLSDLVSKLKKETIYDLKLDSIYKLIDHHHFNLHGGGWGTYYSSFKKYLSTGAFKIIDLLKQKQKPKPVTKELYNTIKKEILAILEKRQEQNIGCCFFGGQRDNTTLELYAKIRKNLNDPPMTSKPVDKNTDIEGSYVDNHK